MIDSRRRHLILGLPALLLPTMPLASALLRATPVQTAGPFYPPELPLDDDNDLTRVAGTDAVAAGHVTDLSGRVLDVNGTPLTGLRIEIWQCDANGRYRHPRDRGGHEPDPNFQGHGHTISDPEGRYRFRTIRPVPYPGRTPHIHMAVFPKGTEPFTYQLYVAGEPRNEDDFLFRQVPVELRHLVTAEFSPRETGTAELASSFDLVLGVAPQS